MTGRPPTDAEWQGLCVRSVSTQFYAVKTTGIICKSGCPARQPNRENVLMFSALQDGIDAGFRLCKRCRPGGAIKGLAEN